MYRTTSIMALGLFLSLAPVGGLAQTQTDDELQTQQELTEPETGTQQQLTEPEADEPGLAEPAMPDTDEPDVAEPATPDTDEPDVAEPAMPDADEPDVAEPATPDADEPDVATAPADDVIIEQDDDTMLATALIGASVMLADESIGTVSNLIIGPDYELQGVVVGVGGFLGIGEKRVALPLERITIQRTEPGEVELTANTTREELEEAEAFRTAAQIRAEREAEQAEQMQQQPTFE